MENEMLWEEIMHYFYKTWKLSVSIWKKPEKQNNSTEENKSQCQHHVKMPYENGEIKIADKMQLESNVLT